MLNQNCSPVFYKWANWISPWSSWSICPDVLYPTKQSFQPNSLFSRTAFLFGNKGWQLPSIPTLGTKWGLGLERSVKIPFHEVCGCLDMYHWEDCYPCDHSLAYFARSTMQAIYTGLPFLYYVHEKCGIIVNLIILESQKWIVKLHSTLIFWLDSEEHRTLKLQKLFRPVLCVYSLVANTWNCSGNIREIKKVKRI